MSSAARRDKKVSYPAPSTTEKKHNFVIEVHTGVYDPLLPSFCLRFGWFFFCENTSNLLCQIIFFSINFGSLKLDVVNAQVYYVQLFMYYGILLT